MRAWAITAACSALLGALFTGGCDVASPRDPDPPAGGNSFVLDYNVFVTEIDTILTAQGCDNLNCHGGWIRGTFELSPVTSKDVDMDFFQVRLQVDAADPAASMILLKPLDEAAGGTAHAATPAHFASTSDPDYQAILAWIEAGYYQ